MRRNENLTVYYHCNEEYPQIISSFDQVSSEKDYEYPSTTPVIVTFRQKVSYLDAELKEHVATKTIKYFLGKEEAAERVITHPDIYKVLNPIDFYESCYNGRRGRQASAAVDLHETETPHSFAQQTHS